MITVPEILAAAGIAHERRPTPSGAEVYLTAGNQLVGCYADLKRFQSSDQHYYRWQAHHIVEYQELDRFGIHHTRLPPRERQICVLVPEDAQVRRVNGVLRSQNPVGVTASATDLRRAYRDAYALVGDYSGGGAGQVKQELVAIVDAIFRKLGLVA